MKSPSTPVRSRITGCWRTTSTTRAIAQVASQLLEVGLSRFREAHVANLFRKVNMSGLTICWGGGGGAEDGWDC